MERVVLGIVFLCGGGWLYLRAPAESLHRLFPLLQKPSHEMLRWYGLVLIGAGIVATFAGLGK